MERKLNDRQKKLVISKLRSLKSKPSLLAKYDQDGDGVVTDEEWERARRDVIRQVLREESSRLFEVAPIINERTSKSGVLMWMHSHRETLGLICVIVGGIMILTDPGTFAPRGEEPLYQDGMSSLTRAMDMLQYWLNWSSSGWAGFVLIVYGLVWESISQYLVD